MAKGIKKAATISAAIMILLSGTIITGCDFLREERVTYEYQDFKYNLIKMNSANKYEVYLQGLTEEGKTKEVIVVPSEIDGHKVTALSSGGSMWADETAYDFGFLESENLKAIYLPKGIEVTAVRTFEACPNLEKIIILAPIGYYNAKLYNNQKEYIRFRSDSTLNKDGTAKCGTTSNYANVSYLYNYDNAKNKGFYWIDNFAYGEKITFIPEDPTRDGYTFCGWYKEETCENEWDFGVDTLPEAKYNENGDELYQETRLYAKWTEA